MKPWCTFLTKCIASIKAKKHGQKGRVSRGWRVSSMGCVGCCVVLGGLSQIGMSVYGAAGANAGASAAGGAADAGAIGFSLHLA